ncbi:hypothetical protein D3C78_1746290 [compost metagenome]
MCQLIHQDQGRMACQSSVKVELLYLAATMLDAFCWQDRQPLQQRRRFLAAMGFHHANQHV